MCTDSLTKLLRENDQAWIAVVAGLATENDATSAKDIALITQLYDALGDLYGSVSQEHIRRLASITVALADLYGRHEALVRADNASFRRWWVYRLWP